MNANAVATCGCGKWIGERCAWTGPVSEMVVVEYMPDCWRASHEAANNSGSFPHNGSVRVACNQMCAKEIVTAEPEWAEIIDRDPAQYAEDDSDE